jgi:hypothetical protein
MSGMTGLAEAGGALGYDEGSDAAGGGPIKMVLKEREAIKASPAPARKAMPDTDSPIVQRSLQLFADIGKASGEEGLILSGSEDDEETPPPSAQKARPRSARSASRPASATQKSRWEEIKDTFSAGTLAADTPTLARQSTVLEQEAVVDERRRSMIMDDGRQAAKTALAEKLATRKARKLSLVGNSATSPIASPTKESSTVSADSVYSTQSSMIEQEAEWDEARRSAAMDEGRTAAKKALAEKLKARKAAKAASPDKAGSARKPSVSAAKDGASAFDGVGLKTPTRSSFPTANN